MNRAADTRRAFSGLFDLYVPIAAGVFALVVLAIAVVVIRDRASRPHATSDSASAPRTEMAYALLLAVIAAFLVWRTFDSVHTTDGVVARAAPAPGAGPAGLTVRVVAAKWDWRFEYPGGVAVQGAGPDHVPTLVVPARQTVRFRLTSIDVMHAFWIPEARYKADAIPGRTNTFDMAFDPNITYTDDRCSEFCGQYHAQMQFKVAVLAPARFRAWLRGRQARVGGAGA